MPADAISFAGFLGLLGAIATGFIAGVGTQAWRARRDEFRITCDDFCKLAGEAADLGAAYWSTASSEKAAECSLLEAKLLGSQRKLSGYAALFRKLVHPEGAVRIERGVDDLFDLLTGGEFKNPDRIADMQKVIDLQVSAAELVVGVRTVFMDKVSTKAVAERVLQRTPGAEKFRSLLTRLSS